MALLSPSARDARSRALSRATSPTPDLEADGTHKVAAHSSHHARRSSGADSAVPPMKGHSRTSSREGGELPPAEAAHMHAQRMQPSYSTAAYRDFISRSNSRRTSVSELDSAAASAASSVQSSAMPSVAPSGASTQWQSRAASPRQQQQHQQVQPAPVQLAPLPHHAHAGHGQLSMASLQHSIPIEDDDDSVVVPPRRASIIRPKHFTFDHSHVIKSHKKSAEKEQARAAREAEAQLAAQRERELALAQQLAQHQRDQAVRDAAYKLSQHRAQQDRVRQRESHLDTSDDSSAVDDSCSSDSSDDDDDSPPMPGKRPHSPLPPSHFRFDQNDLRKSYSKPSQRQAIGHWTTFPRSSTVMAPAAQLRNMIAQRQQTMSAPTSPRGHVEAQERARIQQAQQQAQQSIRQQLGDSRGSLASRGHTGSLLRRSSMPHVSTVPPTAAAASPAVPAVEHHHARAVSSVSLAAHHHHPHTSSAPHLAPLDARYLASQQSRLDASHHAHSSNHSRSNTLGALPLDKVSSHHSAGGDSEKLSLSADRRVHSASAMEKRTNIRARSNHSRVSSAGSVESSSRRNSLQPVKAMPLQQNQAVRAAQPPPQQPQPQQQSQPYHRGSSIGHMSVSHVWGGSSVPASAPVSPRRALGPQQAAAPHSRLVSARDRSAHVHAAQGRSVTLPLPQTHHTQSHAHLPPQQPAYHGAHQASRAHSTHTVASRALHGSESKSSSAATSPAPARGHAPAASVDYNLPILATLQADARALDAWSAAYPSAAHAQQQSALPQHAHKGISGAALYKDVPSSGYGR